MPGLRRFARQWVCLMAFGAAVLSGATALGEDVSRYTPRTDGAPSKATPAWSLAGGKDPIIAISGVAQVKCTNDPNAGHWQVAAPLNCATGYTVEFKVHEKNDSTWQTGMEVCIQEENQGLAEIRVFGKAMETFWFRGRNIRAEMTLNDKPHVIRFAREGRRWEVWVDDRPEAVLRGVSGEATAGASSIGFGDYGGACAGVADLEYIAWQTRGAQFSAPLLEPLGQVTRTPAPPAPVAVTVPAQTSVPAPKPVTLAGGRTRATIRGDGTLLVDGRPVFPIGMRTEMKDSLKPISDIGFNLVLGSGEWTPEHYALARQNNLLVLGGHYLWATFHGIAEGIDLKARETAALQMVLKHVDSQAKRTPLQVLSEFDNLPGVIGWNTNEEPEAKLIEPIEYAYEIFKSNSPDHLVVTMSCDPQWFHMFKNTADVLIMDNYPFRGVSENRPLAESYDWLRRAIEAMDGKPVWLMPQAIPPGEWTGLPTDELTLRDMRLQCYTALAAGAKGLLFYSWECVHTVWKGTQREAAPPDVIEKRSQIFKALVSEVRSLEPILCDGRAHNDLDIRWLAPGPNGPGPQIHRAMEYYGKQYLLVVNFLDVPVEASVYSMNVGNKMAYSASVFQGETDLKVLAGRNGEPRLVVGPRGAGVFALERRPITQK